MVRKAETHDIWSAEGRQWLQTSLNLTPGRAAVVEVVENRVHVRLHAGTVTAEWLCESGGEWVVQCPVHGARCGTPFSATGGLTVLANINSWAAGHG